MDWITPLKSQQNDFILRLKSDSAHILGTKIPGCHSELVTIAPKRFKEIRSLCRKLVLKSEQTIPVREVLLTHLRVQLAEEVISTCLNDFVNQVDPEYRLMMKSSKSFTVKTNSNIGIGVKADTGNIDTIRWVITAEDVKQNAVLVCIFMPEEVTEDLSEYSPILAGFLPTQMLKLADGESSLALGDLLYGGGLRGYLESLSSEQTSQEWLRPLKGRLNFGYPVAISADSSTLASCSYDGKISLWLLHDGNQETLERSLLRTFSGHSWSFGPVSLNPEGRVSPSSSEPPMIPWEESKGQLVSTMIAHNSGISCVALSRDGQILASGGYDGTIKIWQPDTGQLRMTLPGHSQTVKLITISNDGHTLVSGTDQTIKVWSLVNCALLHTFSSQTGGVLAIAISPDGHLLASGGQDGTIKLRDLHTGELRNTFSGHAGMVLGITMSPDGQTLATTGIEKTIKTWDLNSGKQKSTLTGLSDPVIALAIDSAESKVALNLFRYSEPGWRESSALTTE